MTETTPDSIQDSPQEKLTRLITQLNAENKVLKALNNILDEEIRELLDKNHELNKEQPNQQL
jgi:cell division protein FtsB